MTPLRAAGTVRDLLNGLPERWLPECGRRVGWALHGLAAFLAPGRSRSAQAMAALLLHAPPEPGLLACARGTTVCGALLGAWRRGAVVARLCAQLRRRAPVPGPRPLLLLSGVGYVGVARRVAQALAWPHHDLEAPPRRGGHALWTPFLGRWCCVDARPLRAARRRGRPVRLLLALPGPQGRAEAWLSPDLAAGAAGLPAGTAVAATAAAALEALGLIVRSAPERVHWGWPRLSLRPTPTLQGHALSSRWAPWVARRARRRARPGR